MKKLNKVGKCDLSERDANFFGMPHSGPDYGYSATEMEISILKSEKISVGIFECVDFIF